MPGLASCRKGNHFFVYEDVLSVIILLLSDEAWCRRRQELSVPAGDGYFASELTER